ncbi:MAG: molybdopterin-binding protein, partial [Pseudomonadota bacterium]
DDITADAIAAAFQVEISEHPEVIAMLAARYAEMDTDFTPARRRMARIPHGASLIDNPVSGAPGFQTENVFTLAGVPKIVEGMLGDIGPRLKTGAVVRAVTVRGSDLREGDLAEALVALSEQYDGVSIGSYPWFRTLNDHGVALIARGSDEAALKSVSQALVDLVKAQGVEPDVLDGEE